MLTIEDTEIKEVKLLIPDYYQDNRGGFFEAYNQERFLEARLQTQWVQDNVSVSRQGVIRGLHFQQGPHAQTKLIWVASGEILDVAIDLRPGSSTFRNYMMRVLSAENHFQLYIPKGFAHGFQVLSSEAVVCYKCDAAYHAASEKTLLWSDPSLGIPWKAHLDPIISVRDANGVSLLALIRQDASDGQGATS